MKFVDEVVIYVRAGKGGDGCVAFRREKFIPKGGPAGGDGGRGGDVIIRTDAQLSTLLDLRYSPHQSAENGKPGEGSQCNGRDGKSKLIKVPIGTQVFDHETSELLCDLTKEDEEFIVAQGGKGGLGNMHFKSSVRQAPRIATPGKEGEEKQLRLELKLLADVGIIGMPNVGKSTLISRISRAKPKIADYPFTTLVPNLGMVPVGEGNGFIVADIPGLIPGASDGAGLGIRFLRHIERCGLLIHLLEVSNDTKRTPLNDLKAINKELAQFSKALSEKEQIIVLNKLDLTHTGAYVKKVKAAAARRGYDFIAVSAVTGENIKELIALIWKKLEKHHRKRIKEKTAYDPLAEAVE